MSYQVTLPSGIRFTLCPPGISEGAYTVEADQHLRKFGHTLGPLVFCGNRTLTDAEIKRRENREYMRKKREKKMSPSPVSAETQPNSE